MAKQSATGGAAAFLVPQGQAGRWLGGAFHL